MVVFFFFFFVFKAGGGGGREFAFHTVRAWGPASRAARRSWLWDGAPVLSSPPQ